jgi:hypothetical protein
MGSVEGTDDVDKGGCTAPGLGAAEVAWVAGDDGGFPRAFRRAMNTPPLARTTAKTPRATKTGALLPGFFAGALPRRWDGDATATVGSVRGFLAAVSGAAPDLTFSRSASRRP